MEEPIKPAKRHAWCVHCDPPREFVGTDVMKIGTTLSVHVANAHPDQALTVFDACKLVKVVPHNGVNIEHPTSNVQRRSVVGRVPSRGVGETKHQSPISNHSP